MRQRSYGSPAHELRELIAQLEMKSQVTAAQVGRNSPATDDDIGGKRPSGGIDYKDDHEPESILKSADYFRRKQARCRTEADLERVIVEIRQVLDAWGRQPPLAAGMDPERDTFRWRCTIADDPRRSKDIQKFYGVSRSTVTRYRAQYAGVMRTIWTTG